MTSNQRCKAPDCHYRGLPQYGGFCYFHMERDDTRPLWLPTAQVERVFHECRESSLDTVGVDRKTLEGLIYDSLLWRQERAARSAHETKSQVTVWGRPRWTVERPNDPCINCGCTRFICTGCIGASSEKVSVRCTCFEDDHGPDCDIDGCCGQCTGQNGTAKALCTHSHCHNPLPHVPGEACNIAMP